MRRITQIDSSIKFLRQGILSVRSGKSDANFPKILEEKCCLIHQVLPSFLYNQIEWKPMPVNSLPEFGAF